MRKIGRIAWFWITTILLFAGCSRQESRPISVRHLWPASGVNAADSLMVRMIEADFANAGKIDYVWYADSFAKIVSNNPENAILKARLSYIRSFVLTNNGNVDSSYKVIDAALSELDSVSYPYDYNRLNCRRQKSLEFFSDRYSLLTKSMDYFKGIGDSLTIASLSRQLAILWKEINDNDEALKCFKRADDIWKENGYDNYVSHNRLNIANMSSPEIRDSIYEDLRSDKYAMADTPFYETILRNSFMLHDSLPFIMKAKSLADQSGKHKRTDALNNALISQHYQLAGVVDSAIFYGRLAASIIDTTDISHDNRLAVKLIAETYLLASQPDSANIWLKRYIEWGDTIQLHANMPEVFRSHIRHNLAMVRHQHAIEQSQHRLFWIALLIIVCLIFFMVLTIIYALGKRRELKRERAERALEYSNIRNHSMSTMIDFLKQTVGRLKTRINELENENIISPKAASSITSVISSIVEGSIENQVYLDGDPQQSPEMMTALKKEFPKLTQKQLNLACYIVGGMTTVQIARMLNISSESVNKARYRLRNALLLQKDQELDSFLRDYVANIHSRSTS